MPKRSLDNATVRTVAILSRSERTTYLSRKPRNTSEKFHHGVARKGPGDAQLPNSEFASVWVVEMGESFTPDPLRGIGSVISDYACWFGEFPPRVSLRLRGAAKQRNFKKS